MGLRGQLCYRRRKETQQHAISSLPPMQTAHIDSKQPACQQINSGHSTSEDIYMRLIQLVNV